MQNRVEKRVREEEEIVIVDERASKRAKNCETLPSFQEFISKLNQEDPEKNELRAQVVELQATHFDLKNQLADAVHYKQLFMGENKALIEAMKIEKRNTKDAETDFNEIKDELTATQVELAETEETLKSERLRHLSSHLAFSYFVSTLVNQPPRADVPAIVPENSAP